MRALTQGIEEKALEEVQFKFSLMYSCLKYSYHTKTCIDINKLVETKNVLSVLPRLEVFFYYRV